MTYSTIRLEMSGAVGVVTLARPDKLNALSRLMVAELTEVAERLGADPDVRCLVVAAEGPMFSAGADLEEFRAGFESSGIDEAATQAESRLGSRLTAAIENPELVTIAAVQKAAIGGAAALVAACDLRVFAEGARLVVPELAMGVPLAWGGMERLVRDLGPAVVRDLVLTGRPLGASEALSRGFACAVEPADSLLARARGLADLIASRPAVGTTIAMRRLLAITDRSELADDDAVSLARSAADPAAISAAVAYLESLSEPRNQEKSWN